MSTFLVSLGVVAAAIVAVTYGVLNGPDQPPTIRRRSARVPRRPGRRHVADEPVPAPRRPAQAAPARPAVGRPGTPALAGPDSDIMRLHVLPARQISVWIRIRSGIALVVLVAVLGALLALAVGGVALAFALLVRSATG